MAARQQERRTRFQQLFPQMPLWEVWQEERPAPTEADPDRTRMIGHCKSISRSVRRDMARKRSKREYRQEHGFPTEVTDG